METLITYKPENYDECNSISCNDCFYDVGGLSKCDLRKTWKKDVEMDGSFLINVNGE
jgi:hypothetical protein